MMSAQICGRQLESWCGDASRAAPVALRQDDTKVRCRGSEAWETESEWTYRAGQVLFDADFDFLLAVSHGEERAKSLAAALENLSAVGLRWVGKQVIGWLLHRVVAAGGWRESMRGKKGFTPV